MEGSLKAFLQSGTSRQEAGDFLSECLLTLLLLPCIQDGGQFSAPGLFTPHHGLGKQNGGPPTLEPDHLVLFLNKVSCHRPQVPIEKWK